MTSITIPSNVTSIGERAFSACTNLTDVTINSNAVASKVYTTDNNFYKIFGNQVTKYTLGSNVRNIGNYAFYDCTGINSLSLSNNILLIGDNAFYGCSGLTSVSIPSSVKLIGLSAFQNCTGLTSVTIPASVYEIGYNAFAGCTGLETVTINSNAVASRKYNPSTNFRGIFGSQVKTYTLGNDIVSIGDYAFNDCRSLTSITIPANVSAIGNNSFQYCTGLKSLSIPAGVKTIGTYAFQNCTDLTSVTIPTNVSDIGNNAFTGCEKLVYVYINSNAVASKTYTSSNNLGTIFGPQVTRYTFDSSVTSIGDNAFYGCSGVKSFNLPSTLKLIGHYAFQNCSGMTSLSIPSTVTFIGSYAFRGCSGLTSVSIPGNVTTINSETFRECTGLTSVKIPESVTKIASGAFTNCTALTKAEFGSIAGMCKITYTSVNSNPLSYAQHLYIGGQEVTDLVIPEGIEDIGYAAFNGCTGLTSVTIPSSVTNIGNYAFNNCTGLNSITCKAQSVPTTGASAFVSVPSNATLYVAKAAVSDYQSTSPWSKFTNIQGINVGPLIGDANQNGEIEIGDVTKILWIMAGGE